MCFRIYKEKLILLTFLSSITFAKTHNLRINQNAISEIYVITCICLHFSTSHKSELTKSATPNSMYNILHACIDA